MPNLAVITGASSGIGRALAEYHAEKGGDLVISARREAGLNALKAELEARHGVTVHVVALDLAERDGAERLYQEICARGLSPDILINNAGFGGLGLHVERDLAAEQAMIDLNVRALVTLTRLVARDMVDRGSGRILNVGSTAGFMPGPNQAVYFATKAFVLSYSQALAHELKGRGVTCTVLAPGFVETEFAQTAKMEHTRMARSGGATAQSVARIGYDAMMAGKLVVINDWRLSFVLNWIAPFLPRRMLMGLAGRAMSG